MWSSCFRPSLRRFVLRLYGGIRDGRIDMLRCSRALFISRILVGSDDELAEEFAVQTVEVITVKLDILAVLEVFFC